MKADVEARLTALQADMQQTQQALTELEQARQGLLQTLIGQQYAVTVLQGLLTDAVFCNTALSQPVAVSE